MSDTAANSQVTEANLNSSELPREDIAEGWVELSIDADNTGSRQQSVTAVENQTGPKPRKKKQKCRFFATKRGCRAGEACPYLHDKSSVAVEPISSADANPPENADEKSPSQTVQNQQHHIPSKEQQDPRTFQINQIVRRFRARQETTDDGTAVLHFSMPPSDPDFPFDINDLECILKIPVEFPKGRKPILRVTNKEMERGYQINVEQGFDKIWSQASNPTLLNAFKMLDKQLEVILTSQKAEVIKLVANAGFAASVLTSKAESANAKSSGSATAMASKAISKTTEPARPIITPERRAEAQSKREAEVQVLEHRLGRDPKFSKAADGTLFTVPIEPRKRNDLPSSLQAVKAIELLVPLGYDIEPCSIELFGVDGEAANNVSKSFVRRVKENPQATLLAHVNYLAQNMHLMAVAPPREQAEIAGSVEVQKPLELEAVVSSTETKDSTSQWAKDTDREHVKIIQRPPEWDKNPDEDEGESTEEYDSEFEIWEEDEEENAKEETEDAEEQPHAPSAPREKGILVSFPDLELHGIELLELILVNLTVKCERCKDTSDITKVKPHSEESQTATTANVEVHSTSCKKCANPFSIGYRKDIMHAHSVRAGYLDLEGCTVVDLLPSTFLPTCADCSTPATANGGVVSVRGESSLAICRSCHHRMTFKLPQVKFLNIGPSSLHGSLPLRSTRKPKKESLGIVAGTPLPNRGRCVHYAKSYRWFRFSCCNAVYPCDRCHDKETDHPNEFANRMICGWCSREQHYRPEDCIHCRKGVTGRTGSGFWEGGKGTRERARMSRKDPRKYKRRGGGATAARSK